MAWQSVRTGANVNEAPPLSENNGVVRQKSVLPEAGDAGASLRQKGCYPITP
jgi:hypothetical protein